MIITTSHTIEGREIASYLGIVCGACVSIPAGGNKTAQHGWKNGVNGALKTMEEEAAAIRADAVLAVQSTYINSTLCLIGTAVKLK